LTAVVIGLALGAIVAWLLRGVIARAGAAPLQTRVESAEEQLVATLSEIATFEAESQRAVEALQIAAARRSAAEATAAGVPELEERLLEQQRLHDGEAAQTCAGATADRRRAQSCR
jgi:hypothetical protein